MMKRKTKKITKKSLMNRKPKINPNPNLHLHLRPEHGKQRILRRDSGWGDRWLLEGLDHELSLSLSASPKANEGDPVKI
jgi:hypothetical protein